MKFTFTNKEEYLAYRSEWKAGYKELSNIIREKKWMRKEYSRAYNKAKRQIGAGRDYYSNLWATTDALLSDNKRYAELKQKYKSDKIWLEKYRAVAKDMNEDLKLAKIEAQRQYLEQKNLVLT